MSDVYVFDAYGTLFDVHAAVARHASRIGPDADTLSRIWRLKQLEYTWVLTLTERYEPFWTLTERALDFALASCPGVDTAVREDLLRAYRVLDSYPEVPETLRRLRRAGARTAILSNGDPGMLSAAVESAGIGALLDHVLSVEPARCFKTRPQAYALVTEAFAVPPEAITFVSSNRWDVAGATAFGFSCIWVNRSGAPDEYGDLPPRRVVEDLASL